MHPRKSCGRRTPPCGGAILVLTPQHWKLYIRAHTLSLSTEAGCADPCSSHILTEMIGGGRCSLQCGRSSVSRFHYHCHCSPENNLQMHWAQIWLPSCIPNETRNNCLSLWLFQVSIKYAWHTRWLNPSWAQAPFALNRRFPIIQSCQAGQVLTASVLHGSLEVALVCIYSLMRLLHLIMIGCCWPLLYYSANIKQGFNITCYNYQHYASR